MTADRNIVCPHCAAVNRVAGGRDPSAARCGVCKAALFDGHPVDADAAMYARQIARSGVPVLVDVWAPWCGPCRMMAPAYAAAAVQLEPEMRLIKLNSDAEPDVAARLGIRGIPTMILFRDGREQDRVSGAMNVHQIVEWARGHLQTA